MIVSSQGREELSCISIILCDDVYRDETTKKMVIVGTFNRVGVQRLPAPHPKMCVLFSLTNGNGLYDLSLAVEHERTGNEIVRISGPLEVRDPLMITDVNVELRGVEFPEEGKYWITLRSGETVLQQRPFVVQLNAQPSGGE